MIVTKVSEITTKDIADFIRLDEVSTADTSQLETLLIIAKNFIANYTALDDLDEYADLVICVYILCQDMWDNRTLYVDKASLSYPVETILGMHSINLL